MTALSRLRDNPDPLPRIPAAERGTMPAVSFTVISASLTMDMQFQAQWSARKSTVLKNNSMILRRAFSSGRVHTPPQGSSWSPLYTTIHGRVQKRAFYKSPTQVCQVTDGIGMASYNANNELYFKKVNPISGSGNRRVDYRHADRANALTMSLGVTSVSEFVKTQGTMDAPDKQISIE